MKMYPKRYENVFIGHYLSKAANFKNFSLKDIYDEEEFRDLFKQTIKDFEKPLFDFIVKFEWLRRNFTYKGKCLNLRKERKIGARMYGIFLKLYVGTNSAILNFQMVRTVANFYIDIFFEDFDNRDPFKEKLEFPYENIGLSYLCFIYNLPVEDRIGLLEYADRKKMSYINFIDFAINHAYCLAEEDEKYDYKMAYANGMGIFIKKLERGKDKNNEGGFHAK